MSEHTPGPWGLSKAIHVQVMAGGLHVATIPRAADGDWSEANARLIAAAPDLLEALKGLVDYLQDLGVDDFDEFTRAWNAVHKAESKQ